MFKKKGAKGEDDKGGEERDSPPKKRGAPGSGRNSGFGGNDPFGFDDDLFAGFPEFDKIEEMMNKLMKGMFDSKGMFPAFGSGDGKPIVYGFSMKTGPDGKPVISEFGNVKPGTVRIEGGSPGKRGNARMPTAAPIITDAREPLIDVMLRDEDIIVIAELPGVGKEDISLEALDGALEIKVDVPGRRYYKSVKLPAEVKTGDIDATYNNGVLEVRLRLKEPKKGKGTKVTIK